MKSTSPGCRPVRIAARSPAAHQRRAGGHPQPGAHLGGDDPGEGRLAEPGRSGEEQVVDRLAAPPGRLEHDRQVLLQVALADELGQAAGPQAGLDVLVGGNGGGVDRAGPLGVEVVAVHERRVLRDGSRPHRRGSRDAGSPGASTRPARSSQRRRGERGQRGTQQLLDAALARGSARARRAPRRARSRGRPAPRRRAREHPSPSRTPAAAPCPTAAPARPSNRGVRSTTRRGRGLPARRPGLG